MSISSSCQRRQLAAAVTLVGLLHLTGAALLADDLPNLIELKDNDIVDSQGRKDPLSRVTEEISLETQRAYDYNLCKKFDDLPTDLPASKKAAGIKSRNLLRAAGLAEKPTLGQWRNLTAYATGRRFAGAEKATNWQATCNTALDYFRDQMVVAAVQRAVSDETVRDYVHSYFDISQNEVADVNAASAEKAFAEMRAAGFSRSPTKAELAALDALFKNKTPATKDLNVFAGYVESCRALHRAQRKQLREEALRESQTDEKPTAE